MSDDHYVPIQMIRRFASDDRRGLLELRKPDMIIGTKWRPPKGILFAQDYYKDIGGDIDPFFRRIEQRFARHYAVFVEAPSRRRVSDGVAGAALVDWIASMLSRTSFIVSASTAAALKDNPAAAIINHLASNSIRLGWYSQMQDMISRPNFKWASLSFPADEPVVLSDNPVLITKSSRKGPFVVICPLTKRRVLVGGHRDSIARFRTATPRTLNKFIAAWAGHRIYGCSRAVLEHVVEDLSGHSRWATDARKPFCGHVEKIRKMRNPTAREVEEFWSGMLERFGPSILNTG
ncbi:MAG: DUF4238 domain-containing protein [Planctomycetota bacterium]